MDLIALDIEYYKTNKKDFIGLYPGKHIVIKGMEVIGVYNTNTEALYEATKLHEQGSFIIERPMDLSTK